jgi:hypothetical protein
MRHVIKTYEEVEFVTLALDGDKCQIQVAAASLPRKGSATPNGILNIRLRDSRRQEEK